MTFPLFIEAIVGITERREMGWMFMFMGAIVVPLQGGLLGRLINKSGGATHHPHRVTPQRDRHGTVTAQRLTLS